MKLVRFLMNIPNSTNQPITVELKNGNIINGTLLSCTPSMNLNLRNVKLQQLYQDPILLQFINIRGNQIRQILLPEDLNIDHVLQKSETKIKGHGAGPSAKPIKRGGSNLRGRGRGRN
ncbi:smd1 [Candida jiufengensis]|uniref:smd1 n=1 Tax=Candida jiufengensis TaxID=497108 RepID=UPI0022246CDC|nr:smd1 [Candida jiufengensis]KAI5957358.1 smd1 [Candida jiufengensis]